MTCVLFTILIFGFLSLFWYQKHPSRRAIYCAMICFGAFIFLAILTFDDTRPLLHSAFGPIAAGLFLWLTWLTPHATAHPQKHPASHLATRMMILWCLAETLKLIDLSVPSESLSTLTHPFAPIHIWTSILGRFTLILALCEAAFDQTFPRTPLLAGTFLQAIAIFTGIIWAHDAWHSAWNWDPIETLALITLIASSAATLSRRRLWFCVTAIAIIATLFVTDGALATTSQHSYGINHPLLLAFYLAFLITVIACLLHSRDGGSLPLRGYFPVLGTFHRTSLQENTPLPPQRGQSPRNAPCTRPNNVGNNHALLQNQTCSNDTQNNALSSRSTIFIEQCRVFLSNTAAYMLTLLSVLILFGYFSNAHTTANVFCILFFIFAILHFHTRLQCLAHIILLFICYIQPLSPTTTYTLTPLSHTTVAGSTSLLSIDRSEPLAHATIRIDLTPKTISFDQTSNQPRERALLLHKHRLWRIHTDTYTPSMGLVTHFTDITFFVIWLFFALLSYCILFYKMCAGTRPCCASIKHKHSHLH